MQNKSYTHHWALVPPGFPLRTKEKFKNYFQNLKPVPNDVDSFDVFVLKQLVRYKCGVKR